MKYDLSKNKSKLNYSIITKVNLFFTNLDEQLLHKPGKNLADNVIWQTVRAIKFQISNLVTIRRQLPWPVGVN